jgi:hypothetical protein
MGSELLARPCQGPSKDKASGRSALRILWLETRIIGSAPASYNVAKNSEQGSTRLEDAENGKRYSATVGDNVFLNDLRSGGITR